MDEYDRWRDDCADKVMWELEKLEQENKLVEPAIDQLRAECVNDKRSYFFERPDRFDELLDIWTRTR